MSLPVLTLSGSPHDQGLEHGRQLRDRIARNIEVYFRRFEAEGLDRVTLLERASTYGNAIREQWSAYYEGRAGVAEGSGLDPREVTALNVRYELLYYQFGVNAEPEGCTSFAVSPSRSANGHTLFGQTWDWIPEVQGAILHTVPEDGPETLAFTEAGIFGGKIGVSANGVALAVNGMNSSEDDWSRLKKPFHVRCHEILRSPDRETATRVITGSGLAVA